MESRVELEPKLHFFEHYSLQKLDEYMRNALFYSLDILCNRDPRFVRLRYHIQEICALVEVSIHGIFMLLKNASFSEYLYSYRRNAMGRFKKVLSVIGMILIPYAQTKLKDKHANIADKPKLTAVLRLADSAFALLDFWLKSSYLLSDQQFYSPYFLIFGIKLNRNNQPPSRWDNVTQFGMLGLFLGLRVLDYYYSKQQGNIANMEVVPAPVVKQRQNVCPICTKQITNPAFLQTCGMVYCFRCIYELVTREAKCPVTKQVVDQSNIMKMYQ